MRTPPVIPRASLSHEGLRPMLMWLLQVRNWRSPRVEPKRSIAAEGGLEVSYPQHPQPDPPPRDPSERPPLWGGDRIICGRRAIRSTRPRLIRDTEDARSATPIDDTFR